MYPFEPIRAAWDTLWAAVHRSAPWTPATLRWTDDVHATWADPNCVVGQACGWPVAALLRDTVDVVGAFTLTVPGARGHRYRSVLVGRDGRSLVELAAAGAVAVANSADSLSGWISFLAAVDASGAGAEWPGEVIWSGRPHREPASPAGRSRRRGVHRRAEHDAHQAPLPRARLRTARDRQRTTGAEPSRHRPVGDPGCARRLVARRVHVGRGGRDRGGGQRRALHRRLRRHSTTRSTPPRCCSSTSESLDGHSTTAIEAVMSERSYR